MASVAFEGGPAEGVTLPALRRLPVFLRVVYDRRTGKWDALDRLEDERRSGEEVHVYVRRGYVFACGRGGGGSGASGGPHATYAHVEVSEAMRLEHCATNEAWREFVADLAEDVKLPTYHPNEALHG